MKNKASLQNKIYRKIHWYIFNKIQPGNWFRNFYPAYLHGKRYARKAGKSIDELVNKDNGPSDVYLVEMPNEGAGTGHQISNYNAGLHYAKLFGCKHVYVPFSEEKWNGFLGFGKNSTTLSELKKEGYKLKRLPFFDEDNEKDYAMIKNIADSYSGKKVVLITELDQFYVRQYEIIPEIKAKFENADSRKDDKLIYNPSETNVAVHIRRGDIVIGQTTGDKTLTKRWLDNDYFVKVLDYVRNEIKPDKPLHIYVFSQGDDDYSFFEKYGKVTTCLDMSAMDSFLHLVRADILVMSKSSFSYKPALLSDGIRICPDGFWHEYPQDDKWIVMH